MKTLVDLVLKTVCGYTDGSKQRDGSIGCACLTEVEVEIIMESRFRLMDGDGLCCRGPCDEGGNYGCSLESSGELDIYSDSRSAFRLLNSLVKKHRSIAEISVLMKRSKIEVYMH